jgi:hypothetical protein
VYEPALGPLVIVSIRPGMTALKSRVMSVRVDPLTDPDDPLNGCVAVPLYV